MIAEAATRRQEQQEQERRRAVREKTLEALWDDVAKRQREDLRALYPAPSAPASAPVAAAPAEPTPGTAAEASRRFVVPNVIDGEAPVVRKPGPTFADVLRTYDPEYRRRYGAELTEQQDKVLREMLACYTPLLGTHEWTCGDCGTVVELPNACNNRHCCTCGGARRRRWAENIAAQILPIEYGHLIFTVPHPITQLAMINQRELYSLVLREGAYALLEGGRQLFGIELALLSLPHSWGQLLLSHLHTHSLFPLGGLRENTLEWVDLSAAQLRQLLAYVRRVFPRRFCKALRKAYDQDKLQFTGDPELAHLQSPSEFEQWLAPWENRTWVVRCGDSWDRRQADFGPDATMKVVGYLANYVGRIALSDSRILDIDGDRVLFKYKDYRDHNQQKGTWIEGVELIHRFLQHLLPPRFRHIRCYGWMAPRVKPEKRAFIRQYHGLDAPEPEEEEPDAACDAALADADDEEARTQTCRFCRGQMTLSETTVRPRVPEVMDMPLRRFRRAQVGVRITLGDKLPQIEAECRGDASTPDLGERFQEIKRQLIALMSSGSL